MDPPWWVAEEAESEDVARVLAQHGVRHAAILCRPAVANVVSHCLFDHAWRQGSGQRQGGEIAFQLNYAGVRALEDAAATHPLADLLASGEARVVRGQVVKRDAARAGGGQGLEAGVAEGERRGGFRFVELFAGIGGFRVACEALGGRCVFAAEINREARQTYEANFAVGEGELAHDLREVEAEKVPEHELLTAGFPCQSFTSAGEARGFADERGQLFFEVVRVLRAKRPACFVLENVPNLANVDGGLALRVVVAALQREGYRVAHRVLDGGLLLAQARRRIFIVGARDGRRFAWPEMPDLGLAWRDIAGSGEEEEKEGEGEGEKRRLSEAQRAAMRKVPTVKAEKKVRTIMASYKRSHRMHSQFVDEGGGRYRFLSPREVARAQGFPPSFRLDQCLNANSVYAQLGNAVPPPLAAAVVAELVGGDRTVAAALAMSAIQKSE